MAAQDHSLDQSTLVKDVSTIFNTDGKDKPLFMQSNPWNLISHDPKNAKENYLHKFLFWIGFLKESDKNLLRRIV